MAETYVDDKGDVRLRDYEFVCPICVGTVSFFLGKKASEQNSHKWTVYVRSPNNDDLTHIISKVTFTLHHTFKEPERVCEGPLFEVTEHGWGEFEIGVTIHFASDACEKEVEIFHKLKLYGEEDATNPTNPSVKTVKPVVAETYDELVFWEPIAAFAARVSAHEPQPLNPPSALLPHFPKHSEAEELEAINACRAKVGALCDTVRRQFEGTPA